MKDPEQHGHAPNPLKEGADRAQPASDVLRENSDYGFESATKQSIEHIQQERKIILVKI